MTFKSVNQIYTVVKGFPCLLNISGIQDISISVSPDGVVDIGDPVKMFCDVIADPTANITWTKDRKVVGTARRLALTSIKEADSGSYTCTASNRAESKSLTVHLSVRCKLKTIQSFHLYSLVLQM